MRDIISHWRVSFSGMWRRVVRWVSTDVSEEHIASIFRVEEIISAPACLLADTLHNHRCENLKSYLYHIVWSTASAKDRQLFSLMFCLCTILNCAMQEEVQNNVRNSNCLLRNCGIPGRGKKCYLCCIHARSGAHQASYLMGTGNSFPGGKAVGTWN
jgi:hypothetical protein